jgi:hypothetical protein
MLLPGLMAFVLLAGEPPAARPTDDGISESRQQADEAFDGEDFFLDWLILLRQDMAQANLSPIPSQPKVAPNGKGKSAENKSEINAIRADSRVGRSRVDISAVHVNREELSAQISGLNLNLRAVETELDERKNWDVKQLTAKIAGLKTLAQQRRDVVTVRDLLSDEDRKYVARPHSIRPIIAQLGGRIAGLRAALADGNSANPAADLDALDQLSQDLAALAAE